MTVTSSFGATKGIDLAAPAGTPLVAFTDGTVSFSQSAPGGEILEIHGTDGNLYVYMHLRGYAVADGATVQAGQLVKGEGKCLKQTGKKSSWQPGILSWTML